jgi:competence protein ComEC
MLRWTRLLLVAGLLSLATVACSFCLPAFASFPGARPAPALAAARPASPYLRLIFVDVGQGDAVILRSGRWTGLIDGGPAGSAPRVSAQLRKAGARRIDCLVLSHLHADHIGGLLDLVGRFRPRTVLLAGGSSTATWGDLRAALKRVGARLVQVRRGKALKLGAASAKVLSPGGISGEANEDSVVLLLTAAGRRFLFTGDVTGANEAAVGVICARGPPLYLLKVAHHASRYSTSSSFLAQTRPRFATICVGANSYGHPAPQTIVRLKSSGTRIYSTQKNGNVKLAVSSSGKVAWSFSRSGKPVTGTPGKPQPGPASGETIVYITATGECYHCDGCRYLSHSKIAIKLSEAKAQGYRPCSVCDPPA